MDILLQDLRFSVRRLIKNPVVSLAIIFSLTIGIGGNATIFGLINATLFRSLPVIKDPERLVWFFSSHSLARNSMPVSYPDYVDFRDQNKVFSGLIAFTDQKLSLITQNESKKLYGELVSGNYFSVLGVGAMLGRTIQPEDDQKTNPQPVAVLSYGQWQRNFGSDPNIVSKVIVLNGVSFSVIGVMAKEFIGTEVGLTPDVWIPITIYNQINTDAPVGTIEGMDQRDLRRFKVLGRLKNDVSLTQAYSATTLLASNLEQAYPQTNKQISVKLLELSGGVGPQDRQDMVPLAILMLSIFTFVLLIACINVVGLLLTRAALRQKEIAVCLAVGASRWRLIRQLLVESLVLFVIGGGLGLLFTRWTAGFLLALAPSDKPIAIDSIIDGRTLAYTLLLSLITGIIFGLIPALQASKPDLLPAMKSDVFLPGSQQGRLRLRNIFLVVQVAFSVMLLVCAGFFIRSLQNSKNIEPGFEVKNGFVVPIELGMLRYTKENGQEFYRHMVSQVEAMPGVRSASLTRFVPLGSTGSGMSAISIEGSPRPLDSGPLLVSTNTVGVKYFQTMGIPMTRGRDFNEQDREGSANIVIINEIAARQYWPDKNPVGKRISFGDTPGPYHTIIGVVQNSKYETLAEEDRPFIYQPLLQNYNSTMHLIVRSLQNEVVLIGTVRNQILGMEKKLAFAEIRTLSDMVNISMAPARTAAWLLGVLGFLALLLAAIGLYGVLAYTVSQRTREIGIRVSLGAMPRDVMVLILGDGMRLVTIGLCVGVIISLLATRTLSTVVYGGRAFDLVVFVTVILLLGSVALVASYIPARRGTKVNPVAAIRFE